MKRTSYSELPDEDVIARVIHGPQPDLFEIIYNRYYDNVLDKCFGLLKNRRLAEEFAGDIFSKVYEKLSGFGNRASFSSWLYTITYNHCIDYLREKKNLHYPEWNRQNVIPENVYAEEDEIPEINYDNLLIILDSIHPEEKAMLLMKYKDGLTLKEIASSLRISEDAVKMRLKRARTRVFYLYKKRFINNNR